MKTVTLKLDRYSKIILTIIALALGGILLKDLFKPSPAQGSYDQTVKISSGSIDDLASALDGLRVREMNTVDVQVINTVDVCETCQ